MITTISKNAKKWLIWKFRGAGRTVPRSTGSDSFSRPLCDGSPGRHAQRGPAVRAAHAVSTWLATFWQLSVSWQHSWISSNFLEGFRKLPWKFFRNFPGSFLETFLKTFWQLGSQLPGVFPGTFRQLLGKIMAKLTTKVSLQRLCRDNCRATGRHHCCWDHFPLAVARVPMQHSCT